MTIQIVRGAVEIRLIERPLGPNNFVARVPPGRNQNDHDAAVRQQNKSHVLEHRLGDRRRNHDSQSARNFRQHMSGALGNFFRRCRRGEFAANPFLDLPDSASPAPPPAARKIDTPSPSERAPPRCAAGRDSPHLPGPPSRCESSPNSAIRHGAAKSCAKRQVLPFRCTRGRSRTEFAGCARYVALGCAMSLLIALLPAIDFMRCESFPSNG